MLWPQETLRNKLPYILSDMANDKTINGVLDVEKRTERGQKWIEEGLVEDNEIIPVEGVDFVMSTNVPLVSGAPVSGKSSWATYITADETMFSIALGGFPRNNSCGAEPLTREGKMRISLYRGTPNPKGQSRANCVSFDTGGVETTREKSQNIA